MSIIHACHSQRTSWNEDSCSKICQRTIRKYVVTYSWYQTLQTRLALIICDLGLNNYHQQPEMKDCRTSPEMVHSWEEEIGQTEEHPVMGFPGKLWDKRLWLISHLKKIKKKHLMKPDLWRTLNNGMFSWGTKEVTVGDVCGFHSCVAICIIEFKLQNSVGDSAK